MGDSKRLSERLAASVTGVSSGRMLDVYRNAPLSPIDAETQLPRRLVVRSLVSHPNQYRTI